MLFIGHRVNRLDTTIAADTFARADGIEFDLRSSGSDILVVHDPGEEGQNFNEFIKFLHPEKLYIVNIKTEGIEERVLQALQLAGIHNFFLLDCSIPMMVRLGKRGEKRLACRYSEYESLDSVVRMAPFVSWVWIDCFNNLPITRHAAYHMRNAGLKLCLVSPELQGHSVPATIEAYRKQLHDDGIQVDAVCSKLPNRAFWDLRSFSLSHVTKASTSESAKV
jgi:hypothetical protein